MAIMGVSNEQQQRMMAQQAATTKEAAMIRRAVRRLYVARREIFQKLAGGADTEADIEALAERLVSLSDAIAASDELAQLDGDRLWAWGQKLARLGVPLYEPPAGDTES